MWDTSAHAQDIWGVNGARHVTQRTEPYWVSSLLMFRS